MLHLQLALKDIIDTSTDSRVKQMTKSVLPFPPSGKVDPRLRRASDGWFWGRPTLTKRRAPVAGLIRLLSHSGRPSREERSFEIN